MGPKQGGVEWMSKSVTERRCTGSAARGSSKIKSDYKLTAPLDFSVYFYPHNSLFLFVHYFSFVGCQKPLWWCAEGGQQGGVLQCLGDRLLLRIGGRGGKAGWRLALVVRKWALRDGRAGGRKGSRETERVGMTRPGCATFSTR